MCTCTGPYPLAYGLDPETGLWVHGHCRRPTRPELERRYRELVEQEGLD